MNLIVLDPSEVDGRGRAVLSDGRARHIRATLKAAPGTRLRVGLLDGPLGAATVEADGAGAVELRCAFEAEAPPQPRLELLLAMPRPKVVRRLWAQLAAIGVRRIVLLRAAKVERFYFDSHVLDPAVYTPLLVEGLQQARCTRLPEVRIRPLFKPFVEDEMPALYSGALKLVADPAAPGRLGDGLGGPPRPERAVLAIGPEGGWTPHEMRILRERGFRPVGMGPRVLRTDTAAVAMLCMLAEELERR